LELVSRSRAQEKYPEPCAREEVLEERFAELLDRWRVDDEVLAVPHRSSMVSG
jgi:hypothetical protein